MISSSNNILSHFHSDRFLLWSLRFLALIAGSLLVLIVLFLLHESLPAFQHIGLRSFFADEGWYPSEELYLLTPILWGTIWATLGSIMLAAPLGISSAVCIQYYAPPFLAKPYRRLVELLAGIPSVVFGLWGLVVLVPLIARWQPPGPSLLAGILVLSVMILPTITLVTLASLAHIPASSIHSATALGLGRWSIIQRVILPTAKAGIFTGIFLGVARALGETMAILMVCGNVVQAPSTLFDPIRTLTANIALEMAYALGNHRSTLFVSGLFLMVMVVVFVIMAEGLRHREAHAGSR
ncbi:MAG: phosphate ABC transporter permease subunit PstC [Nitrospirota bacterium]|nr:phosphate ABC transporter permease subunit PstC [Nitrospirota bacterium]